MKLTKLNEAFPPLHAHPPSAGHPEDCVLLLTEKLRHRTTIAVGLPARLRANTSSNCGTIRTPSSPASAPCLRTIASSLTDPDCREAVRLLRIVLDSLLRLPLGSQMVKSAQEDLVVIATSAASPERNAPAGSITARACLQFDGANGRADIRQAIDWLGEQRYLSLLVEAGSKVNWAVLEAEAADKIYFYYAPKILGGTESLPMAGGLGRRRRSDAIQVDRVTLHPIAPNEFAVEGYVHRDH